MSNRESRAQSRNQSKERPPQMTGVTPLRIVLLGKSASESSRVGNFILGRSALDSEAPPDVVERVGGRVKDRHVTLINSPHLLQTNISEHQITQTLRECVSLSDPEPHVFILTLQYRDFTEEDMRRVKYVLHSFSQEALRRTIIITTDEETRTSPEIKHTCVHQLMKECGGGRLEFKDENPGMQSNIFKRVYKILKRNPEEYLTCEIIEEVKGTSVDEEQSKTEEEKMRSSWHKDDGKHKSQTWQSEQNFFLSANLSGYQKLNLVLCGNDSTLVVSVSTHLRGKRITPSHERAVSSDCVKKEEKISGRLLSVVELPALSRLSEEEVMRQTLLSVTLCHPGVHAFICIVNVGQLNNKDKAEIEKIQMIFDSKKHFILLFTSDLRVEALATEFVKHSPDYHSLISRCEGQYRLMGLNEPENSRQIPDLLDYLENMKTEPYSPQMYVKAQENRVRRETEEKYEEELKRIKDEIKELQVKEQPEGAKDEVDDQTCLRIVLIGKTGSGKSATGNTILGREEFHSKLSTNSVTTVCEKGVGKVAGRLVAVVDTPGLFDTKQPTNHLVEEIMKCVSLSSPGPHVFLIVLSLGRFTNEEMETLDLIKKIFGPKAAQFSIVLFTRGDDLDESIEDYVKSSDSKKLKKLIRDCGDRFMVFNNKEKQDRTQVIQLIKMIEKVKKNNHGRYFTNRMFEEAEMTIEELKRKYEEQIKEMKKQHEDETKKQEEEFNESKENKVKHVLDLTERLKNIKRTT